MDFDAVALRIASGGVSMTRSSAPMLMLLFWRVEQRKLLALFDIITVSADHSLFSGSRLPGRTSY